MYHTLTAKESSFAFVFVFSARKSAPPGLMASRSVPDDEAEECGAVDGPALRLCQRAARALRGPGDAIHCAVARRAHCHITDWGHRVR
jgi:hypothetical protein